MSSQKEINKFFKEMDDEDLVNGYLIKLPNSHPCCYDELWLLDVNDETGLAPILIEDINGSSIHALWCCNFDNCCEEEDAWDLETLVRMVGEGWSWWRKGLLKVMEAEERAKRPPTEEAEEDEYRSLFEKVPDSFEGDFGEFISKVNKIFQGIPLTIELVERICEYFCPSLGSFEMKGETYVFMEVADYAVYIKDNQMIIEDDAEVLKSLNKLIYG